MAKGIFVTATDTGIGKTVISAGLAMAIRSRGIRVGVMKPVATGCFGERERLISADAVYLFEAAENEYAPLTSPIRFRNPVAPSIASVYEQKEVDLDAIRGAFGELQKHYDFIIVEGIGGLLVPIKKNYLVANLIREFALPLVIVSNISLGAINHTLLTVDAALIRGFKIKGIIFNRAPLVNYSLAEMTNPRVIHELTGIPILGVVPEIQELNVERCRFGSLKEVLMERINIDAILNGA
ncbi:MAG: dethiobiotin synthase [Omnitrophica bacterium RIFCSPHIGHO2_02_FULL_49_9]|nr:MAG: dethiobiotin synthase [Omnitrophica bacterium RIFCSPHIGHO2_02_FULL_49_9]OGW88822.1 MAG: dethiobiotin synthase [Omnitrophica bacterium RIFCSPLOWO2_01_FULL_50_24]